MNVVKPDTKIYLEKYMFTEVPRTLIENTNFKVSLFKYKSGIEGIRVENEHLNFVILPTMGHQIWELKINGVSYNQKTIFDYPLANTKFGDNYGGFLLHCGLTNINAAAEGEDYPLHGELPFAKFEDNVITISEEDGQQTLEISGLFTHRNAQDYYFDFIPTLKLKEKSSVVDVSVEIKNKRNSNLEYMYLCHMNWFGFDQSNLVYSVKDSSKNVLVPEAGVVSGNQRDKDIYAFNELVRSNPKMLDKVDFETQNYNPELCLNYKYSPDEEGWAHSLQVKPEGDSCYVAFDTTNLEFGIRWYCVTDVENGIGFCLPSTSTNHSTKYQKENNHFNTIEGIGSNTINFKFGYLDKNNTDQLVQKIEEIKKGE